MSGTGWVRAGAVLGFLAVAIGAFGAHGLKEKLDALGTAATFQTGVQYHMFHTLAVLMVGLLLICRPHGTGRAESIAAWSFLIGILLFSGSLYVLSVTGIKLLGAITPFGGVAFLVGWAALVVAATVEKSPPVIQRSYPLPSFSSPENEPTLADFGLTARTPPREENSR